MTPDDPTPETDRVACAKRQREALRISAGSWKAENHPELDRGGAAYIDEIRSEPDERFDQALNPNRS